MRADGGVRDMLADLSATAMIQRFQYLLALEPVVLTIPKSQPCTGYETHHRHSPTVGEEQIRSKTHGASLLGEIWSLVVPLTAQTDVLDSGVRADSLVVGRTGGIPGHHPETGGELMNGFACRSGVSDGLHRSTLPSSLDIGKQVISYDLRDDRDHGHTR